MAAWSTTAVSLTCTLNTRRGRNGGKELLVDRGRAHPCVWVISCCYLSADWIVVLFWLFFLGLLPTARPPRRQHIMQHHWFTFCYIVVFLIVPRIINKLKHLDRALHKQERTHCIWIPLLAAWVLSLCFTLGFFLFRGLWMITNGWEILSRQLSQKYPHSVILPSLLVIWQTKKEKT